MHCRLFRTLVLLATLAPMVADMVAAHAAPVSTPVSGERLSTWLSRQTGYRDAYLPGLLWGVPTQREEDTRLRNHLLGQLFTGADMTAPVETRQRLSAWLQTLSPTGRVIVPTQDPQWLEVNPDRDPTLETDHVVRLPARPTHVLVLTGQMKRCALPHRSAARAVDYVRQCEGGRTNLVDRAWTIQPDGVVQGVNIAPWNREAQAEPAPGAMIWAPARHDGWPKAFSARLAQFLATQDLNALAASTPHLPSLTLPAIASPLETPARSAAPTANDWGLTGLLQTPSARMAESGAVRFHYSMVAPYSRGTVMFQPLDWLEAGFRYTDISNRLYGPAALSGTQSYKDKSLDFKIRLLKETAERPEIAFGITDIGGTGLFSSEYLVASKRHGDFDFNLGIAWGYLGGSNNLGNPFSLLGQKFKSRTVEASTGSVSIGSLFHGSTAIFGGVQYQTAEDKLILKLEYDSNNYRNEPQGNTQKQSLPINAGVVYRLSPSVDLAAGVERGNTLMLSLTLRGGLDRLGLPHVLDPPKPGVLPERPVGEPDWPKTAADLERHTQWRLLEISRNGADLRVRFEDARGSFWNDRIERVATILHRDAPADIQRFIVEMGEYGQALTERVILRTPWALERTRYIAAADRFAAIAATEPRPRGQFAPLWARPDGSHNFGLIPTFSQSLGGPDGFVLYNVGVAAQAELRFNPSTWLNALVGLRLADNYDKFNYTAPSNLPRVRTFKREYLRESRVTLPTLSVSHLGRLTDSQFFSVYGGYLESMFAGVGGEWLYRPWHSPFAFGIDVNRVAQRNFDQHFGLRDYRVTTGHASLYWDTGWHGTSVKLSAGQYLAGDRGVTMDISRTFDNGVSVGAYATKTNISAATFGEGSFDKGIYVGIPFDALLPMNSSELGMFNWAPLTRDGGARLARPKPLYELTRPRDPKLMRYRASLPGDIGPDDLPEWVPESSIWSDLTDTTSSLGHQVRSGDYTRALLLGSGIVLASSTLDKSMARWADNHQGTKWTTLGKVANFIPLGLAAGTGILWWGAGGPQAADTAWSSIKAAALTLGVETLVKISVGRARPEQGLGVSHFDGFGRNAANSSFPSIHTGTAFSLVTPFAQQFDAPWLYAIAGATAFGRIQHRQHFFSDVVAGSLLGYGFGTAILEHLRTRKQGVNIQIGMDRSIEARWKF